MTGFPFEILKIKTVIYDELFLSINSVFRIMSVDPLVSHEVNLFVSLCFRVFFISLQKKYYFIILAVSNA